MSQIKKICHKCNKLFTSEYLLNRHINRTISCDILLECERCKIIFTSSTKLIAHRKKKIPCDMFIVKNFTKLDLVNAKEQSELTIIKVKADEKLKLAEFKAETAFKLQELKNASKYNTTKILNDRAEVDAQHAIWNKKCEDEREYEIMYMIAYKASKYTKNFFTEVGIDTIFRDTCSGVSQEDYITRFTKAKTCTQIVNDVITSVLNDGNPKNKNLFYNSRIGVFSAITNVVINNICQVTIIKYTYAEVFNILYDVIEHCYNRYNGSEMALYGYKCQSIIAKNDIADKFARFDCERKSFAILNTYNKQCLSIAARLICDKPQTDIMIYKPQQLQTSEKIISCQLQDTIIANTNIYLAGPSSPQTQGTPY